MCVVKGLHLFTGVYVCECQRILSFYLCFRDRVSYYPVLTCTHLGIQECPVSISPMLKLKAYSTTNISHHSLLFKHEF